jgi:CheY-like chemotaxis protein
MPISHAEREKNRVILLLDDDDTLRHIIRDELQKFGCVVIDFADKEDGLDWIQDHHVDLVLSDINSPGMDGISFLNRLRGDFSTARVPLVFVTGMAGPEIAQMTLALGAQDYLTKPFDVEQLSRCVRKVLQSRG